MKNKKKVLNFVVLFMAIALVLYFTLKDNFTVIIENLKNVNVLIFLIAIAIFMLSLVIKAASLKIFINEYHSEYSLKRAFNLTVIGQFLNGITPFQSGGQPFQVYLLKKQGVRITDSTNAMLKDYLAFQTSLILIGIFAFVLNIKYNVFASVGILNSLIFVGFSVNFVIFILLIFIVFSKKKALNFLNKTISFIYRFKIVKRFRVSEEKAKESLEHFCETGEAIGKNKKTLVKGIIYNVINLVLLYVIPVVIFYSLGVKEVTIMGSIIATAFVMLIGNITPIPGATGGVEYGFIQFFSHFIGGPMLSSAMLLWRFVTYFFGMILGGIFMFIVKEGKLKK